MTGYSDLDYVDIYDYERDDDHVGTSMCPGTCQPMCDWCLFAHVCPDECGGVDCPYVGLEPSE